MLRLLSAICVLACLSVSSHINAQTQYKKPSDIPVEVFAALPIKAVKLSPSGHRVAFLSPKNGRYHLVIQNLDGSNPIVIPPDERVNYYDIHWKTDDALVFEITATLNRTWYIRRGIETRLVRYNIKNKDFLWLGRNNNTKGLYLSQNIVSFHEQIVDLLSKDPNHILMQYTNANSGPVVVKVNINSGFKKTIKEAATGITDWNANPGHQIQLGWGLYYDKKLSIRYKLASGKWLSLQNEPWAQEYDALYPANETDSLYVTGPAKNGNNAIFKLSVSTKDLGAPLFEVSGHDVYGLVLHPDGSNNVVGYIYMDDYKRYKYSDPELALIQNSIDRIFPDTVNTIHDKAMHHESYVIKTESDTNSGDYYLYNRAEKKLSFLISVHPRIDAAQMANTKVLNVSVSSKQTSTAYVTTPKTGNGPFPTIIIPRTDTYGRRSDASWNFLAQFLANRGWMVVQPNTEGTMGYGNNLLNAGIEARSTIMQNSLSQIAHWLLETGYSAPDKLCIMGTHYGGYAAIYGVISDSDIYSCAISIDGHLDLTAGWQRDRYYIGGTDFVNSLPTDTLAKDISPLHRAANINKPILLLATRENSRIEYKQSQNLHKKLKQLNKPHTYIQLEDTDEMFLNEQSRIRILSETEKFLKQHLN